MKRLTAAAATLGFALGAIAPTLADDKQLQNVKGSVSYQAPHTTPVSITPKATVGLADQSYAITGAASLGAVILPDSSQIMVGSSSKVQLAYFNQVGTA
ncbi:MAG TPA: hypothetical protein VNG31_05765, partial [Candidatus Baltobacteraceae bacterium]|nr:hypothetical protein [Candidatus Baltobacteraceae bacterium]